MDYSGGKYYRLFKDYLAMLINGRVSTQVVTQSIAQIKHRPPGG